MTLSAQERAFLESEESEPLVTLRDIAEIELVVLRRMREFTLGDHASVFKGPGFNFVGIRDWEPGDRMSSIDWAQSSMTNFSPMIVRDFEQDSNAAIVAVCDASLSTRCGTGETMVAVAVARALAAVGLSAQFFQDMFGVLTFDEHFQPLTSTPAKVGRSHVLYCLDLYQRSVEHPEQLRDLTLGRALQHKNITSVIESQLRRTSLVPVISDFLFPDVGAFIRELSLLNAVHDVFLMMADVRFAYDLPSVSDGWVQAYDMESGQSRVLSRRELARLASRVEGWQEDVMRLARDADLDIVRIGLDRWEMETTLVNFAAERRLRKR
jgi:uncharacterized protein (DUF58 family)